MLPPDAESHTSVRVNVLTVAVAVVAACAACWLMVTTPQAVPFGDVAVIEMMTKAVTSVPVFVGPYSQYGWNHPGPMPFYLMAPLYALSGYKTVGMALSAAAINIAMLFAIWRMLARHLSQAAALAVVAPAAVFVWRAGDLVASPWNAHMIVLPLVAAITACALASLRDGAALAVGAAAMSLATQASVSVVPCAAACVLAALALGSIANPHALSRASWSKALLAASTLVAFLWWPPAMEQIRGQPGNLSKIAHFFASVSGEGPRLPVATAIWADAVTAPFRSGLELPWGERYVPRGTGLVILGAVLLVFATAAVSALHRQTEQRGLARVSAFAVLSALTALWSTTRIVGEVGGYQVFWMAGVGTLLLGCVVAAGVVRLVRNDLSRRLTCIALGVVATVAVADATVAALGRSRQYALDQVRHNVARRAVAIQTAQYLRAVGAKRARFNLRPATWLQGAGVILHAYREGVDVRMEDAWIPVFGRAFRSDGSESMVLEIGASCPPGAVVAGQGDGLCVHRMAPPAGSN